VGGVNSAQQKAACRALGQAMNEYRVEAGMSVSTLAWFVGVSPWTMQRRLRDAGKLRIGNLGVVALALQVDLLVLLGRGREIEGLPAH